VAGLRALLAGGTVVSVGENGLRIERSLPHGHVVAVRKIALDRLMPDVQSSASIWSLRVSSDSVKPAP
jgi:hypothetical protein